MTVQTFTAQTFYVALPFKRSVEGHLVAGQAKECACADTASNAATQFSGSFAGAIAFSRKIDPSLGTYESARLICSIGDVPDLGYLLHAA